MKLLILKHAQTRLRQRFNLKTKEEQEKFIKETMKDCETNCWGTNMEIISAEANATLRIIDYKKAPKMITAFVGLPYRYISNGTSCKQYSDVKVEFVDL